MQRTRKGSKKLTGTVKKNFVRLVTFGLDSGAWIYITEFLTSRYHTSFKSGWPLSLKKFFKGAV